MNRFFIAWFFLLNGALSSASHAAWHGLDVLCIHEEVVRG